MTLWEACGCLPQDRIAITGGGGKTTVLLQLATEARDLGLRGVVTTTTRMFAPQLPWLPINEDGPDWRPESAWSYLFGMREAEKLRGISPARLDELADRYPERLFLVEADGSKGRPFKVQGSEEPCLASSISRTLVIVGMSGWDLPAPQAVHHLGIVTLPEDPDERLEFVVRRLLARVRGKPVLVLNQADRNPAAANRLAGRIPLPVVIRGSDGNPRRNRPPDKKADRPPANDS